MDDLDIQINNVEGFRYDLTFWIRGLASLFEYWGRDEPEPVYGHLDSGERMVKPALEGRFVFYLETPVSHPATHLCSLCFGQTE